MRKYIQNIIPFKKSFPVNYPTLIIKNIENTFHHNRFMGLIVLLSLNLTAHARNEFKFHTWYLWWFLLYIFRPLVVDNYYFEVSALLWINFKNSRINQTRLNIGSKTFDRSYTKWDKVENSKIVYWSQILIYFCLIIIYTCLADRLVLCVTPNGRKILQMGLSEGKCELDSGNNFALQQVTKDPSKSCKNSSSTFIECDTRPFRESDLTSQYR